MVYPFVSGERLMPYLSADDTLRLLPVDVDRQAPCPVPRAPCGHQQHQGCCSLCADR